MLITQTSLTQKEYLQQEVDRINLKPKHFSSEQKRENQVLGDLLKKIKEQLAEINNNYVKLKTIQYLS